MSDSARSPLQITSLKGVGQKLTEKLANLNIESVHDLIFHLPYKYQDRTRVTALGELVAGTEALICGEIEAASVVYGRQRSLIAKISDGTGRLTLRWFYFNRRQQQQIKRGVWISGFGNVRFGANSLEMIHPEYRISTEKPDYLTSDNLTPIYPLTEGISQRRMRNLVQQSLSHLSSLEDYLSLEQNSTIPSLHNCLRTVHFPTKNTDTEALVEGTHVAQKRLALEELTAHHISLKRFKLKRQRKQSPSLINGKCYVEKFLKRLPFTLTNAQQRVIDEISRDIDGEITMQRLMQGDVGSGKTVVAAAAICRCIGAGYQAVIMAPTELLAEQHLTTFKQWLEPLGIQIEWLSGRLTVVQRKAALENLVTGQAQLIVGTHALFQTGVQFNKLGLVVVDEQHRFGVNQRLALIEKAVAGVMPHQLTMTATPIPRTLAMIFYADMDVSNIDELPAGRKPVETILVSDNRRAELVKRIFNACKSGRQAYWVCPLIDESDVIQAQAVTKSYESLTKALPELSIALIHGRMKSDEKNTIMKAFRDCKVDVLVATTVIEVGVDVPNASLMIIENSERLGLAQLHQLRGRIGRGEIQSCCVLMYHSPLSEPAKKRLAVMRDSNDGFKIAKYDLELRGPGELLGTRQTGLQQLKVANLVRDRDLLKQVEQLGKLLIEKYPDRAKGLVNRWVKHAERYADV